MRNDIYTPPGEYTIKRYQRASYLLRTLKTISFGKNDPQNMNMKEKFKHIKTSLTHYTSFEMLHEKIEPENFFFFGWDFYTEGIVFAFFDKMTYKT